MTTPPSAPRTLQSTGRASDGPLREQIAARGPWFHNLHLPTGDQTAPDHPLGDFPRFKWEALGRALPQDLHGARVLDIGCNAGFYSFALAARGAEVLGIDTDPHYLDQARWAATHMSHSHRVRFECRGVYSLGELESTFDIVLFMGVFYHLRYPTLALDLVADKAADRVVFQSLSLREPMGEPMSRSIPFEEIDRLGGPGTPRMAFIEGELAGDITNWWVPNEACMEALLRSAGLKIESRPAHEVYVCRRDPCFAEVRQVFEGQFRAVTQVQKGTGR